MKDCVRLLLGRSTGYWWSPIAQASISQAFRVRSCSSARAAHSVSDSPEPDHCYVPAGPLLLQQCCRPPALSLLLCIFDSAAGVMLATVCTVNAAAINNSLAWSAIDIISVVTSMLFLFGTCLLLAFGTYKTVCLVLAISRDIILTLVT